MTCIVGLETKNGVIIGCDSGSSSNGECTATRLKKVFRRDDFLIGYTTSFRMGQILQYQLNVDKQIKKQNDLEYLSTTFVDAVRKCFSDSGYLEKERDAEIGGTFLVGYKDKLYCIGSDFQVNSNCDGFDAIGSGGKFAKGAMLANVKLSPKKRIKNALRIAGHFSDGVCGPYYIETL